MSALTTRSLGRTLLARHHLLERADATPVAMVDRLVGLQAQEPRDPYLALWSRIVDFDPAGLETALLDRHLVRVVAMRGTIHLLTARDALDLRHLFQPVLDAELARHSQYKDVLTALDLAPITRCARELLVEPLSGPALRTALTAEFPDVDPTALVFVCRNTLPLVQAPPRGLWSKSGAVTYVAAEHWLGEPPSTTTTIDGLIVRYLRAFGPATVADAATWTRLTGLREVFERLRPSLRTWTDEAGRELFDVADGTIVDGDVPAPVRFLPEYDNVLLSHADRRRVIPEGAGALYDPEPRGIGHVLVDGQVRATWWRTKRGREGPNEIRIRHDGLPKRHLAAVEAEAARALPILAQGADARVIVTRLA